MKKFILFVLCLTFLASASLFMVGCKNNNKHTHSFTVETVADKYLTSAATCTQKAKYFYSCKCGEKGTETFEYGEALGHKFTNYVSGNDATCTEDGTKTAKCDRCDETDTITDTGSKLGHSFTNYESNHDATCTEDGTKTATCDRCNETNTIADVGSKLGHSFTNYVSDNNATYEKDGTKTAHCDHKGCTVTDTITDEGTKLESYMVFKTFSVNGDKVYGKVSNNTETFSFVNEIEAVGLIKYFVSFDIYGNQKIDTKTIPLNVGDNTVYVTELLDGEPKATFEVTIRRRPIYDVTFNTNGGSDVESKQIEEDTIISAPITTRLGYTFVNWSYDFSQPIIEDVNITAKWEANIDTPYKVEYYFENLENNDYTLYETDDLQGITDTTATANIKTYDHFTFNKNKGVLSGNISCDGSLILKVFYTRNTYTLSNTNTSYGIITNATTVKYGNDKIESVMTEYLGCEFIGWFNGEELLSSEKEYLFTAEYNVTAKFKVKDEMLIFNFNSSVDTCKITGLKDKTISKIVIPEYVTSIGDSSFSSCGNLTTVIWNAENCTSAGNYNYPIFKNCSNLSNVTIGDNVKTIPVYAFYNCGGLTSVTIGKSVTSIGDSAFSNCNGLTNITIPDSVTSIGNYAFSGCSGFTSVKWNAENCTSAGSNDYPIFEGCSNLSNVTIGDNVKTMPSYAFYNCSGLTSVTIGDSVTSIGSSAFKGCSGLTSVEIPDSVTSIGSSAFYGCSGLTSINVSSGNTKYYSENDCLIEVNTNTLILGCINSIIPDSITSIGDYAFSNCSRLTSVTIPNSVTSIGRYAFYNCSGLTSVTIPDSVTSIGSATFAYCSGLMSITIPDSITSIGDSAFSNCNGLTNITIPDSVTSIGNYAFYKCSGLTRVTIPDSVTSIGTYAFYGCSGLTSITIPDSVTSIDRKSVGRERVFRTV